MKKTKVADATGPVLALMVMNALGGSWWTRASAKWDRNDGFTDWVLDQDGRLNRYHFNESTRAGYWETVEVWGPDTNWAQGGPIIEREHIAINVLRSYGPERRWMASPNGGDNTPSIPQYGPTPLIAAMRCFVAYRLGDEVEVPEELL